MFEWSKEICKKINDANCLNKDELRSVELALRVWEAGEMAIDESIKLSDSNLFELEHGRTF